MGTKSKFFALSLSTAIALAGSNSTSHAANHDDEFSFGSQIVDAANYGDVSTVKELIAKGTNPDDRGELGVTALMRASYQGNPALTQLLLKSGANPNVADVGGATPLHIAAREGHIEIINSLVKSGANINIADKEGYTPLMRAISKRRVNAVDRLIALGAKVNIQNEYGETAVSQAKSVGASDIAKKLAMLSKSSPVKANKSNAAPIPEFKVAITGESSLPFKTSQQIVRDLQASNVIKPQDTVSSENINGKTSWFSNIQKTFKNDELELASASDGANIILDLGSFKNEAFANNRVKQLKEKNSDALGGLNVKVTKKGEGVSATYYVSAGLVSSKTKALDICKQLVSNGVSCRPVETLMASQKDFDAAPVEKPKAPEIVKDDSSKSENVATAKPDDSSLSLPTLTSLFGEEKKPAAPKSPELKLGDVKTVTTTTGEKIQDRVDVLGGAKAPEVDKKTLTLADASEPKKQEKEPEKKPEEVKLTPSQPLDRPKEVEVKLAPKPDALTPKNPDLKTPISSDSSSAIDADVKPLSSKPLEVGKTSTILTPPKPPEVAPIQIKPVELKPTPSFAPEPKLTEVKPVELKPVLLKTPEPKPLEVKPVDTKQIAAQIKNPEQDLSYKDLKAKVETKLGAEKPTQPEPAKVAQIPAVVPVIPAAPRIPTSLTSPDEAAREEMMRKQIEVRMQEKQIVVSSKPDDNEADKKFAEIRSLLEQNKSIPSGTPVVAEIVPPQADVRPLPQVKVDDKTSLRPKSLAEVQQQNRLVITPSKDKAPEPPVAPKAPELAAVTPRMIVPQTPPAAKVTTTLPPEPKLTPVQLKKPEIKPAPTPPITVAAAEPTLPPLKLSNAKASENKAFYDNFENKSIQEGKQVVVTSNKTLISSPSAIAAPSKPVIQVNDAPIANTTNAPRIVVNKAPYFPPANSGIQADTNQLISQSQPTTQLHAGPTSVIKPSKVVVTKENKTGTIEIPKIPMLGGNESKPIITQSAAPRLAPPPSFLDAPRIEAPAVHAPQVPTYTPQPAPAFAKEIWVRVPNFSTQEEARGFWNGIAANNPSIGSKYMMRATRTLGSNPIVSAQIGPFYSDEEANNICKIIEANGKNCGANAAGATRTSYLPDNAYSGMRKANLSNASSGMRHSAASRSTINYSPSYYPDYASELVEWTVQLGVYNTREQAENNATRLSGNLRNSSYRITSDESGRYKLRLGKFASRDQAERTCAQVRAQFNSCIIVKDN